MIEGAEEGTPPTVGTLQTAISQPASFHRTVENYLLPLPASSDV